MAIIPSERQMDSRIAIVEIEGGKNPPPPPSTYHFQDEFHYRIMSRKIEKQNQQ